MANQNANATISDLVRQHGETLARITTVLESYGDRLDKQEENIDIIAKAVARQEAQDAFWTRFWNIAIPIATSAAGALVGHFIR